MNPTINNRKIEHINIIEDDPKVERSGHGFGAIRLWHRALPERDLDKVDTSTVFMGKSLSLPLLISSMTGGDHEMLRTINRNLAAAAEATGVAMGVGSQRILFTTPNAKESFALRSSAPNALLFANLGGVQLNYGFGVSECQQAVDVLQADALYFHLNPLQEAVQPEGDRNFSGLADKLVRINEQLGCPVILKEVGAGISPQDVALVSERGIRYIDVAGTGGTSWSRIEYHRQQGPDKNRLGLLFQDWGIPTPVALDRLAPFQDKVTLIASGGLRTGIDMAKAIILGASLCGLASPFLKPAQHSVQAVIEVIETLQQEFKTALFLLGVSSVAELHNNRDLILDGTRSTPGVSGTEDQNR